MNQATAYAILTSAITEMHKRRNRNLTPFICLCMKSGEIPWKYPHEINVIRRKIQEICASPEDYAANASVTVLAGFIKRHPEADKALILRLNYWTVARFYLVITLAQIFCPAYENRIRAQVQDVLFRINTRC